MVSERSVITSHLMVDSPSTELAVQCSEFRMMLLSNKESSFHAFYREDR